MARHQKLARVKIKKSVLADEDFLRELRNNPILIKVNFLAKKVKQAEHHRWFLNLLKEHYSYTIYLGKIKVGHIRFQKIKSKIFSIGMALLPKYSGQGIGSKALSQALKDLRKKEPGAEIIAEVKEINIASRKFFAKMGFKLNYFIYKYKL